MKHNFPSNQGYKREKVLSGMKTFKIRKVEERTFKKGKDYSLLRGQEAVSRVENFMLRHLNHTLAIFKSKTLMQGRVSQLSLAAV